MTLVENIQSSFTEDYGYTTHRAHSTSRGRVAPIIGQRQLNMALDRLPAEMRALIEPSLRSVVLKREQFLFQEGDELDLIYFPETAVVSEFKMLEDGRMVELAVTGREGVAGLASIYSGSEIAENFMQVSQAGTAKAMSAETLNNLLRSNEKLRHEMSRNVDHYIKQICQRAICNMYHTVTERLCTWLLMVQDRSDREVLSLTHEQMARSLGVYRPSVTCIAQELREMKLINYTRSGVTISDRRGVENAACTCYAELDTSNLL